MAEGSNVFLVGGRAQLASGSEIDSRQPIRGDSADFCLHQSLSRSEEWWLAVKELIDVLLKDAGNNAWALIWGPKTSFAYKGDGSFSRRRLATTFGSAATADLMKHQSGELKGFNGLPGGIDQGAAEIADTKYRFLEHGLRFDSLQAKPGPAVFVGAYHNASNPLADVIDRWPKATIILPATTTVSADVDKLVGSGKLARAKDTQSLYGAHEAALEKFKDHELRVSHGAFEVTRFVDRGKESDPAAPEAALSFVRTNYDLHLGFWDLTRDEALRETLLDRGEVTRAPRGKAEMPKEAKHAAKLAAKQKLDEDQARRALHKRVLPRLRKSGFEAASWKTEGTSYLLKLGKPIPDLMDPSRMSSTLFMNVIIYKRQLVFSITGLNAQPDIQPWLEAHKEEIDQHGMNVEVEKCVFGRVSKHGWAEENEDLDRFLTAVEQTTAYVRAKSADLVRKLDNQWDKEQAERKASGIEYGSGGMSFTMHLKVPEVRSTEGTRKEAFFLEHAVPSHNDASSAPPSANNGLAVAAILVAVIFLSLLLVLASSL